MEQHRQLAIQAINYVANKNPTPQTSWKIGQKVWLEAKNLGLKHGTIKLSPRRHGPFVITKEISLVAYQLTLPSQWNIHPVFHVSLLMPYTETIEYGPNYSRPPLDVIEGQQEYEVETIVSHKHQ